MKRETREWLSQRFPSVQANEATREIQATLARKNAEIRDLKARLKVLDDFVEHIAGFRPNDPASRKGKRWDILSDVLNALISEARRLRDGES